MQKFFVNSNQIEDMQVNLIGTDVNHIVNVLRMKKGDTVLIGNKDTKETYITEIENTLEDKVILRIVEKLDSSNEPKVEIDLYQGLPKFDKMELIIQKTTEIGVTNIFPVDMSRCIVKIDEKDFKKKQERWQKISEVAAKQSKRGIIPEIKDKIKVKEIIKKIDEYDSFIIAYEEENEITLKEVLKEIKDKEQYKIGILIGPEGGIAKEEVELLKQNGAKVVTLGKRILRCETAPITLCSNIIYELDM